MSAIVDNEDFDSLNVFKWHTQTDGFNFYAARTDRTAGKRNIILHHAIIGKPCKGMQVDHINGDGLDNRKQNLRVVTASQNQWNSKIRKDNVSGQKGVAFVKKEKSWVVHIQTNGKRKYLGYFHEKKDAIKAYKNAEKILHEGISRNAKKKIQELKKHP